MRVTLVLTLMGADRPGLVELASSCVADHGGNWLDSRMCHFSGQFAGILRVEVDKEREGELERALRSLEARGLQVIIHAGREVRVPASGQITHLEVVGQDRPGILRSVSTVLASHRVNVEELSSERTSAPMGDGEVFKVRARLLIPEGLGVAVVRASLESIDPDLLIELVVEK